MNTTSKPVRLIGTLLIIAGLALVLGGAATWITVRSQLVAEQITIPEDAMAFQGQIVDGPFEAYVQADIINHHALEGSGGLTYAELDREDPARATVMNASFLRASLFTSVIAFGIAAFAAGMGVLFTLIGVALRRVATTGTTVTSADADTRHALAA
ncbi:MAG: aromatic ring-opening dioxygenase LigA [Actinotalea sp.]|nr:aromatic ring-opening dioxygenase LigA [Actinotalea sp.]